MRLRHSIVVVAIAIGSVTLVSAVPAHGSSGSWERAWGGDVDAAGGSGAGEICTVAANCQMGSGFAARGGEFANPRAAATDVAGNVYVADKDNHRIQKFDSAGNFLLAWGKDVDAAAPGTGFEICSSAASCKTGSPGQLGGQQLGGEFNNPGGIAVDGDGDVYVADSGNNRIQKFDSAGNFLRAWGRNVEADFAGSTDFEICEIAANCQAGTTGGRGGEFNNPIGVAAAAGEVYVADFINHRIQVFDSAGNFLRAWGKDVDSANAGTDFENCVSAPDCQAGSVGELGGELAFPVAVAADATFVFVADWGNQRIQRFHPGGFFSLAWGKAVDNASGGICTVAADCTGGFTGGLGGEFNNPFGIAVDKPSGTGLFIPSVYVAEDLVAGSGNNRIQKFDNAGNFLSAWGKDVDATTAATGYEICGSAADCQPGSVGVLGGELDRPLGVAAGPAGAVYVADTNNQRIQKFSGDVVRQISINDVSVAEGNSGQTAAQFTVSLDAPSTTTITVDFATADGSAAAPGDYGSTNGTVTFAAGDTSEPVTVQVNGDTAVEPSETFSVNLSNASANAVILDGLGVGTMTNDDVATSVIDVAGEVIVKGPVKATATSKVYVFRVSNLGNAPITIDPATEIAASVLVNGSVNGSVTPATGTKTINPGGSAQFRLTWTGSSALVAGDTVEFRADVNEPGDVDTTNDADSQIRTAG